MALVALPPQKWASTTCNYTFMKLKMTALTLMKILMKFAQVVRIGSKRTNWHAQPLGTLPNLHNHKLSSFRLTQFLNNTFDANIQSNIVEISCNHCFNGKATMPSLRTAWLRVAIVNIKILNAAQKCCYGEFISPATIKRTPVFMWSVRYFCSILTKSGVSRQTFASSQYHISWVLIQCKRRPQMQTVGHDEAKKHFRRSCELA